MNGDLLSVLGGQAIPSLSTVFPSQPTLSLLRRAMYDAVDPSASGPEDKAWQFMSYGQDTEAFSICRNLDHDTELLLPESYRATRLPYLGMDAVLRPLLGLVPTAMREAQALGVPEAYLVYLYGFISGTDPRLRVSGVSSMLTLAAIVQYSRGFYALQAAGGTP